MMNSNRIKNNELQCLLGCQINIAQDRLSYTVNNRKNGDLSRVHAYSPQVPKAQLAQGTALYFISCDFKGGDMKYTENKLEATKAFLEVLGVEYRIVICNTLPRHNWKYLLRTKGIDLARYDEILKACHLQGKQAAEEFYNEAANAGPRTTPLSEQALEAFVFRITQHANQHRVDQCNRIFSAQKIILWSDYYPSLPEWIDEHQVALKACYKAVIEGAGMREGNLIDNIVYKQEELAVGLHINQTMETQPVVTFYNEFSKQVAQTGHIKTCEDFGHPQVLDIHYEDENNITKALLAAGKLVKKEITSGTSEQQLAQCNLSYARLQPSLQKEFVLELLEKTKMHVPSQYKFIDACLRLYKTLKPDVQLNFIAGLLQQPKKKIAAYVEFILSLSSYYDNLFDPTVGRYMLSNTRVNIDPQIYASSDPALLFEQQELMGGAVKKVCAKRYGMFLPLAHNKLMLTNLTSVNLSPETTKSTTLIDVAIDAGADLNIEDGLSLTPLYRAVLFGKLTLAKTLLKAGVRFDCESLSEISNALREVITDSTNANHHEKAKGYKEALALVEQYHGHTPQGLKK